MQDHYSCRCQKTSLGMWAQALKVEDPQADAGWRHWGDTNDISRTCLCHLHHHQRAIQSPGFHLSLLQLLGASLHWLLQLVERRCWYFFTCNGFGVF